MHTHTHPTPPPTHPTQNPSAHFYGGKLRSGVTAADRPPARGVAWPDPSAPLAVLAVEGREERADQGGSRAQRLAAQVGACGRVFVVVSAHECV